MHISSEHKVELDACILANGMTNVATADEAKKKELKQELLTILTSINGKL